MLSNMVATKHRVSGHWECVQRDGEIEVYISFLLTVATMLGHTAREAEEGAETKRQVLLLSCL